MKLLFDENLSFKLTSSLADLFPGSQHVRDVGLISASDEAVWAHARKEQLAIVSKDSDFYHRSVVRGHPPKVIWLRIGNGPTGTIESLLRTRHAEILSFASDENASILALS